MWTSFKNAGRQFGTVGKIFGDAGNEKTEKEKGGSSSEEDKRSKKGSVENRLY